MKPEKLIYTFVSFASYIDKDWGRGVPESGIEFMAKLVHKYDIPITWIVNSRSSEVMGDRINLWHSQYDDNIILWIPAHFSDYDPAYDKRELEKGLIREWSIIEKIFPWADIKVAASGYIDSNMINVLEKLNFQGLWGYCWEQTWWDGITHKGVPWGAWYIDSNRWKVPHTAKGQLVACEWTARDLNSTFHTGSPAVYSTDPDDVLRSGLCTGENIEYWKKLFCDYLLNTDNNEYVFFLQHQESHEMDESKEFSLYPHDHIMETADMLDKFLEYISGFGVTAMNLPCAIKFYKMMFMVGSAWCLEIAPDIPKKLNYAFGKINTIKGEITVSWSKNAGKVDIFVFIPEKIKAILKYINKQVALYAGNNRIAFPF